MRQVLLTYARRRVFRVIAAAAVGWYLLLVRVQQFGLPFDSNHWALNGFVTFLLTVSPPVLLVAVVAALMGHVREQIQDWRACLTPGFQGPHLAGAGVVFLATAVAGTAGLYAVGDGPHGNGTISLLGLLAVVLTAMTVAAWWASFRSPWVSILLAPLLLLALNHRHFTEAVLWFTSDWRKGSVNPADWWVYRDIWVRKELVRMCVLAFDVVALWALMRRLARMGAEISRPRPTQRRKRAVVHSPPLVAVPPRARRPLSGLWARAWHRRVAVFRPRAPWLVAIALCALLLLVTLVIGRDTSDVLRSCVLATILPGIVVGVAWLERWPALGYESLYPARRSQFAAEMALAMAADVGEFWLATTLGVLVPIAVWRPASLASPLLPATILSSAMMQLLMLGGMYWATLWRNWTPYLAVLGLLALATVIPLQMAWSPRPGLSPHGLLEIAFVDMACGLALMLGGFVAWCRGELA